MNIEEIKADLATQRPFYGEQPKISEWKAKEALLLAIEHLEVYSKEKEIPNGRYLSEPTLAAEDAQETLKRIEEVFNR